MIARILERQGEDGPPPPNQEAPCLGFLCLCRHTSSLGYPEQQDCSLKAARQQVWLKGVSCLYHLPNPIARTTSYAAVWNRGIAEAFGVVTAGKESLESRAPAKHPAE